MQLEFFEKKGCKNNIKQAELLESAGIEVIRRNLLSYSWTAAELLPFFYGQKVANWFNLSAPKVKNGQIQINKVDAKEALALLLEDPLLIRRPLLRLRDKHLAGFDLTQVEMVFGIPLANLTGIAEPTIFADEFVTCKETKACSQRLRFSV